MQNVSKSFSLLKHWFQWLSLLGILSFLAAISIQIYAITNKQLMFFSFGCLGIGFGEWRNNKKLSGIKEADARTGGPALLTWMDWKPDLFGILLDLIGLGSFVVFGLSLFGF